MASVLIIDSDKILFDALQGCAEEIGICPNYATSLQDGMRMINSASYDVIIMRDNLPDGAACYAVEDIVSRAPSPEVIIYATQGGNPDEAEHALKCGVWDYVLDPAPSIEMPQLLQRALRYRESRLHEEAERFDIPSQLSSHGIIGRSKATQHCLNLAARISQSDANVLITGESGTGKELFASAIHNFSPRSKKNLTIVDCAALPSSLVESILFGHARGSFTGADKAHIGLIKQSDGGTLFLDEIGELPLEIQKKFLRVIQERKYRPVGSTTEIKSNFRLIAATNKDLQEMVDQGNFREDLLFRLRTFHLELPPLRERSADITELAYFYRDDFCKRNKLKKKKFSPDYLMMLKQYDWPGNVRELFQAMERSITAAQDSTTLFPMHLPTNIRVQVTRKKLQQTNSSSEEHHAVAAAETKAPYYEAQELPTLKEARELAIAAEERLYLATLLKKAGGDIKKCCRVSGLSRSRLYDLLKKYQLSTK